MNNKILTVIGARPQFIKAAPVSHVLENTSDLTEVMVHTGQHFDRNMSDVFFYELSIPEPRYTLNIHGGGHGSMTGMMLAELEKVMLTEEPDVVMVYGDTNSTLAGALAAAKLNIPIAHVEAGLRSFNRKMPEEVNRVLTDHVSELLFCPTHNSVTNLIHEGISNNVYNIGDVMYDATLYAAEQGALDNSFLAKNDLKEGCFAVMTVHRADSTTSGERLKEIFDYVRDENRDQVVLFPVHPRTKQAIDRFDLSTNGFKLCSPLGYIEMNTVIKSASCVYTDSGGLQKEAYFHRVPCVTLRKETEWGETIEAGWNRLWHVDSYTVPRKNIDDYGNGDAANKLVFHLNQFLNS